MVCIPLIPFPPRFWLLKLSTDILLMYPRLVIAITVSSSEIRSSTDISSSKPIFAQLKERFDAKYFFAASVVNELHTPDNGLNIMQYVINRRPNYLHGVVVLRKLMQRKGLLLKNESQETNSLVDAFNSDISSEEFLSKIEKTAAEDSKIYNELIDIIIGQDL